MQPLNDPQPTSPAMRMISDGMPPKQDIDHDEYKPKKPAKPKRKPKAKPKPKPKPKKKPAKSKRKK